MKERSFIDTPEQLKLNNITTKLYATVYRKQEWPVSISLN
jgi:hypothetical protein